MIIKKLMTGNIAMNELGEGSHQLKFFGEIVLVRLEYVDLDENAVIHFTTSEGEHFQVDQRQRPHVMRPRVGISSQEHAVWGGGSNPTERHVNIGNMLIQIKGAERGNILENIVIGYWEEKGVPHAIEFDDDFEDQPDEGDRTTERK